MRRRILDFVDRLRAHELSISVGETMDAVAAVAAAGVEREVLREALATTLVKDEHDRPAFDRLFETAFPLVGGAERRPKGKRATGRGEPALGRGRGDGAGAGRAP